MTIPGIPEEARRAVEPAPKGPRRCILALRPETTGSGYGGREDDAHALIAAGSSRSFRETVQSPFRPLRLIASCPQYWMREYILRTPSQLDKCRVQIDSLFVGCESCFDTTAAVGLEVFLDKIPTSAEVVESDTYSDGGRVDYPEASPGLTISAQVSNRGRQDVRVALAFLGLSYPLPSHGLDIEAVLRGGRLDRR